MAKLVLVISHRATATQVTATLNDCMSTAVWRRLYWSLCLPSCNFLELKTFLKSLFTGMLKSFLTPCGLCTDTSKMLCSLFSSVNNMDLCAVKAGS